MYMWWHFDFIEISYVRGLTLWCHYIMMLQELDKKTVKKQCNQEEISRRRYGKPEEWHGCDNNQNQLLTSSMISLPIVISFFASPVNTRVHLCL
jgi:hypothetical protein